MCGILVVVKRGKQVNKELFPVMLDTLAKRGPDKRGVYYDQNVALGQRRLSIIDLSDAGSQPMWNEDNTVGLLCNGEIYNYRELEAGLKQKHVYKGRCDSERLVHAYEELGQKMAE